MKQELSTLNWYSGRIWAISKPFHYSTLKISDCNLAFWRSTPSNQSLHYFLWSGKCSLKFWSHKIERHHAISEKLQKRALFMHSSVMFCELYSELSDSSIIKKFSQNIADDKSFIDSMMSSQRSPRNRYSDFLVTLGPKMTRNFKSPFFGDLKEHIINSKLKM